MTVAELIAELQKQPPDALVLPADPENGPPLQVAKRVRFCPVAVQRQTKWGPYYCRSTEYQGGPEAAVGVGVWVE